MPSDSCRSCDAPILWAVSSKTGKRIPLDPEPRVDGNVVYEEDGQVRLIGKALPIDEHDGKRYVSHFATCPQSKAWRRG